MGRNACVAVVLSLILSGGAAAQVISLSCTSLQVNSGFTVALRGTPGSHFHVALDVAPGPIWTAEVGPVHLGFTPALTILPLMSLDALGDAGFSSGVSNRPDWVGNVIYAQAVGQDASSPTGYGASNPLARPIHHETPSGSAPVNLGLLNNQAVWVDLPFGSVPFYGVAYTRVGVCSNGFLSFDQLNIDPSEHEVDLRGGEPKVAVLWDDLVPDATGTVEWEAGSDWLRITWRTISQINQSDQNTGQATLFADGSIALSWGAVSLPDGLVGISPGSWTGTPVYADFSASAGGLTTTPRPIFESFTSAADTFDLGGQRLTFLPAGAGYRWIH